MEDKPKVENLTTAMVLAAGYSTRMRELAKKVPKPLIPLNNLRIIDIILFKLRAQKFERVVINLHYLGEKIREYVGDGERYGLEIIYSKEAVLLETGGGIGNAEPFFGSQAILCLNSDVLSDMNFQEFYLYHLKNNVIATMAVLPSRNNRDYSLVLYDAENNLIGFLLKNQKIPLGCKTGIFMGFQILNPEARSYLTPEPRSIISAFYLPSLNEEKKIKVFNHPGNWIDLGSKQQYLSFIEEIHQNKIELEQFMK
jgi:NDP-sugar pyrophosphorylase family protein